MLKNKWEIFIGLCLALILQTRYRFFEDIIGLGEIGLAFFIGYTALLYIVKRPKIDMINRYALAWWFFIYLFVAFLPITAIYVIFQNPGTGFRDFTAYFLCATFVFSLAVRHNNIIKITYSFLFFTLALLTFQFFRSSEEAWYSIRFTGGAKNPNQLGLYIICCLLLTVMFLKNKFIEIPIIAAILFFGIATYSDAFAASLATLMTTLLLATLIPRKYFLAFLIPVVIMVLIVIHLFYFELTLWLDQRWVESDQGGSRLTLIFYGLQAWLDSPLTFLIGNGAGSFSGLTGPFQSSEAHNTPIDILAMGGVLGLFFFYYFPINYTVKAYILNQKTVFACAVGLIIYSLFHFVPRHPVFWFTIFALSEFIWMHKKQGVR